MTVRKINNGYVLQWEVDLHPGKWDEPSYAVHEYYCTIPEEVASKLKELLK